MLYLCLTMKLHHLQFLFKMIAIAHVMYINAPILINNSTMMINWSIRRLPFKGFVLPFNQSSCPAPPAVTYSNPALIMAYLLISQPENSVGACIPRPLITPTTLQCSLSFLSKHTPLGLRSLVHCLHFSKLPI